MRHARPIFLARSPRRPPTGLPERRKLTQLSIGPDPLEFFDGARSRRTRGLEPARSDPRWAQETVGTG